MPRGGPRPNSGRPSKKDVQYQASMRALVQRVVTEKDWEDVLMARLAYAKAGNSDAFKDLEKWVMGKVPDLVQHEGTEDGAPVRVTLRIAGRDDSD